MDVLIYLIAFGLVIMLLPYILLGIGVICALVFAFFVWIYELYTGNKND